jgi:hypothetical protein
MKSGTTGLGLELAFSFHPDGALSRLESITTEGGIEFPPGLVREIWAQLSHRKLADKLIEAAAYDAEQVDDDDAACDEARVPGAA